MRRRSCAHSAVHVFVALALFCFGMRPIVAHTNMEEPRAYNFKGCKVCKTACPPVFHSGPQKARYSPENPSRVYWRGQRVDLRWHRNNHEGGFIKVSLVPVNKMHSFDEHRRNAFWYGCFNQGRTKCYGNADKCGTDKTNIVYSAKITIPKVFPDGNYVLGMMWYGGINWQRTRPLFSNYYMCAFVRIKGGATASEVVPTFSRGENWRSQVPPGKCASGKSHASDCGKLPCYKREVRYIQPKEFWAGRHPPKILRSRFV